MVSIGATKKHQVHQCISHRYYYLYPRPTFVVWEALNLVKDIKDDIPDVKRLFERAKTVVICEWNFLSIAGQDYPGERVEVGLGVR